MIQIKKLAFSLAIPVASGFVSYLAAGGNEVKAVYALIEKPPYALPGAAFPIVWTLLYILMGLSDYLSQTSLSFDGAVRRVYFFQLFLNALWLPVFFRACWFGMALVIIIAMVISVFILFIMLRKTSPRAALPLIPYLIFLAYAAYLNYGFIFIN